MNTKDINIIDIRKYTGSESEIVSCEKDEIIFSNKYKLDDKCYYSIKSYNIEFDALQEIHKYEIPESEFSNQYTRIVQEDIIIIKMHFENKVEVDILDKKTKKHKSNQSFQVNEEITSIPIILNNRYFLFFTDIDDMNTKEYVQYKEKGYYHFVYLCDLVDEKIHLIKNLKIVNGLSVEHGFIGMIPTFQHNNQEYILFNEAYMCDYEYEDIYSAIKLDKLDKKSITAVEALYLIKVSDFVKAIELGKKDIPLKEISKRYLDGWVRFLATDKNNIYFREKDFETQIEKIYQIDKTTFKTRRVKEIDHNSIKGRIYYSNKIYEEVKSDEYIEIKGIYNCDYDLHYKNIDNIWFEEFIDDRYLVTTQWIEDKEDNFLEFIYITDVNQNKCIKYDGMCKISNSYVIVYDDSE